MSAKTLLSVTNLSCQRGDKALFSDLSFRVRSGECWHVIGTNGSGKTSMLRQLAGLLEPQSESSSKQGANRRERQQIIDWHQADDPLDPSPSQSHTPPYFAYLGHSDGLKPELTALENLQFYADYYGLTRSIDLDEQLYKVGLLECADLPNRSMSFGQKRRLGLARVLLADQTVWMLDEPLTGIDINGRALFMSVFEEHLNNGGAVILTHHQGLSESPLKPYLKELTIR